MHSSVGSSVRIILSETGATMKLPATTPPESSCMEVLQTAGEIIMENGGETYRAEETITRMGVGFGLNKVESFAVPSGLFISYRGKNGKLETSVKRVRRLGRNLSRVDAANQVSRQVAAGKMNCPQAMEKLKEIKAMPGAFSGWWSLPAAFLCASGFSALFGGNWLAICASGVVALVVQMIEMFLSRFRKRGLAASVIGGMFTALLPNLLVLVLPALQTELVIAGAVMPLVPGLAMTNAVQDTMRGDMVSGLSHGAQAILTACLIAGGALLALDLMKLITGGMV